MSNLDWTELWVQYQKLRPALKGRKYISVNTATQEEFRKWVNTESEKAEPLTLRAQRDALLSALKGIFDAQDNLAERMEEYETTQDPDDKLAVSQASSALSHAESKAREAIRDAEAQG